jgi:hypothetical protein
MIRPVIGKPIPLGVDDVQPGNLKITLYPNPCSTGRLRLGLQASESGRYRSENASILVTDMVGRIRLKTAYSDEIDVSTLPGGLYFLMICDHAGVRAGVSKFIIAR